MNYLLTGVSGFIGSSFLKYAINYYFDSNSDRIFIVSKNAKELDYDHLHYTFVEDHKFTNPLISKIPPIDVFIMIGSFIPKSHNDLNSKKKNKTVLQSTKNILHILGSIPRKIVYISTTDIYNTSEGIISERSSLKPRSIYGQAKLETENWLASWCGKKGSELLILRLGHIYGPGEEKYKKIIPETIKQCLKNTSPIIYTTGEEKRSYLFIDDCCRLICNAIDASSHNSPINIASSSPHTIKEIVELICTITDWQLSPIIQCKTLNTIDIEFNCEKMHRLLGREKTSLIEGLQKEFEHIKTGQYYE